MSLSWPRVVWLVCVLVVSGAAPAWATSPMVPTVDEAEALKLADSGKWIKAREIAQKVLDEDGDRLIALYVMALVHQRAEGNFARALFLLRKGRKLLEAIDGPEPTDPDAARWHKKILRLETWILGDMDRREEELALLERYDALYPPGMPYEHIWPLLKLGRFDEARAVGKSLIYDDNRWVRQRAFNGLMAVEDELRNRKASFDWGYKGLEATHREACIIASNLALAARRRFDLDGAVKYDQIALKASDDSCPTSPWSQLTTMYLVFGEFQKSLSAFQELRKVHRTASQRQQNEMFIRGRLVELLLALGQFEKAEIRVHQILDQPDRAGNTSASAENLDLSNAVMGWAVFEARFQQSLERLSARPITGQFDERWQRLKRRMSRWNRRRAALRLAAQPILLRDMIRPYYTDVMPWYSGALIAMVGPGTVRKSIAEGRPEETDYPEQAEGYFKAFEGEMSWREGDYSAAIDRGRDALRMLPQKDGLLRFRVEAWLGEALIQRGETEAGRERLHGVLRTWPTVTRLLGLVLPVAFEADDHSSARLAIERLEGSPRFRASGSLWKVVASEDDGELRICLRALSGYQYACAQTPLEGDESEAVAKAIDAFHDKAFAPKIELTQGELNTLDGRAVRMDADQAVKDLLGGGSR